MSLTLDELWAELERGGIIEAPLRADKGTHFHGLCDHERGVIVVDPRSDIVDTLIHELIHRRFSRYGEARVRRETHRLMRSMDDATKQRWFKKYRRIVKKGKGRPAEEL